MYSENESDTRGTLICSHTMENDYITDRDNHNQQQHLSVRNISFPTSYTTCDNAETIDTVLIALISDTSSLCLDHLSNQPSSER